MTCILLTGFEPFGSDDVNPSADIVMALDRTSILDAQIHSVVCPVEHSLLSGAIGSSLQSVAPDIVVSIGLAAGRPGISLERIALNVLDFGEPDNAGIRLDRGQVVEGGPLIYESLLPLQRCHDRLSAAGIPSEISNSAGTFLCNELMYLLLHRVQTSGCPRMAGFVHVPYSSEYMARQPRLSPSLPLSMMVDAIRYIVEECVR
jgi:pyroglutamyl-peptidase